MTLPVSPQNYFGGVKNVIYMKESFMYSYRERKIEYGKKEDQNKER